MRKKIKKKWNKSWKKCDMTWMGQSHSRKFTWGMTLHQINKLTYHSPSYKRYPTHQADISSHVAAEGRRLFSYHPPWLIWKMENGASILLWFEGNNRKETKPKLSGVACNSSRLWPWDIRPLLFISARALGNLGNTENTWKPWKHCSQLGNLGINHVILMNF
jgi:hypothetical protein